MLMGSHQTAHAAPALKHIPASALFVTEPSPYMFGNSENEANNPNWTNPNWLKSRFHFSFAEYSSRANTNFGVLRVMNDDLVQPSRGFGTHPHRDAEIVTYVVRGELSHKDSMGTQETLGAGSIQFMTAGSGIRHSEHNLSPDSDLRFIQMWLTPRARGLKPNYGSMCGSQNMVGEWQHLVSDVESKASTPVKICTDANIMVLKLEPGAAQELIVEPNRQAYLLCIEGTASISLDDAQVSVRQHDAVEIHSDGTLPIKAHAEGAHLLVVEMAHDGSGRTDI